MSYEQRLKQYGAKPASIGKEADDEIAFLSGHTPTPEPPGQTDKVLIGLSAADYKPQRAIVESAGGKIQAVRRFDGNDGLKGLKNAVGKGDKTLPQVTSCKPGDWGDAAKGSQTKAWNEQNKYLASLGVEIFASQHHEPGSKKLGKVKGEGGTAQEYAAMLSLFVDNAHSHGLKAGPIVNGWQIKELTRAQLALWLPDSLLAKVDFVAADHYQVTKGQGDPTMGFLKLVDYCADWGVPWGLGEFNAFDPKFIRNMGAAIRDNAETGAFACLWTSQGYVLKAGDERAKACADVVAMLSE